MEKLQCPNRGSSEVKQVGYPEYKCASCGTSFIPDQAPSGFVDVVLLSAPAAKNEIEAIKVLRMATHLDLASAKRAVENPPVVILQNVSVAEGESLKAALEKIGAKATLKPA